MHPAGKTGQAVDLDGHAAGTLASLTFVGSQLTNTTETLKEGAGSRLSFDGFPWRYTRLMRSVADDLREELQEAVLLLSFEERMALALRLGERGLEMFRQASGLDREAALRELQRQRQAGRTPSKCMSELIG